MKILVREIPTAGGALQRGDIVVIKPDSHVFSPNELAGCVVISVPGDPKEVEVEPGLLAESAYGPIYDPADSNVVLRKRRFQFGRPTGEPRARFVDRTKESPELR